MRIRMRGSLLRSMEKTEKGWKCTSCNAAMLPGIAMESTLVGEEDDIGGCVTLNWGGSGRMVRVIKCPVCGYSFLPPTA